MHSTGIYFNVRIFWFIFVYDRVHTGNVLSGHPIVDWI